MSHSSTELSKLNKAQLFPVSIVTSKTSKLHYSPIIPEAN